MTEAQMTQWEGLSPPYATIVADPPWAYESAPGWRKGMERRTLAYSTMTVDEISALPVCDLAAPGAHLYLWTTNRYLRDAFDIAASWGFTPSTTLVWCKPPRGLGSRGRYTVTTEFVLFGQARTDGGTGRKVERAGALIKASREAAGMGRTTLHRLVRGGKPTGIVHRWEDDTALPNTEDWRRLQEVLPALVGVPRPEVAPPPPREPREVARVETTWWQWPRGAHSEKPPAFLDVVEQVSPGPYVELFARQPRLGWDSWGWGYEQQEPA
jgi:N6-adenosine-specific RNA methylase IME4